MRFLLDANLSPRLAAGLREAGYPTRHVDEIGLLGASDAEIFDRASEDGDVVITADSDFSLLLAARGSAKPSVILLRHVAELRWPAHHALLVDNLPAVLDDLEDGAVVSLSPTRLARAPVADRPLNTKSRGVLAGGCYRIGHTLHRPLPRWAGSKGCQEVGLPLSTGLDLL